ncbi:DUF4382 domain-containing protein [Natronorubrum bangense]|uniref:DUF4382 domain-containing protein n=2 Tax=Natronorubrum bangense TaxID=61858 RepID=L9WET0_9EURY|nr:DUF4382 domain-containing protein [Natronorubrum bangense]ELY47786.1 hypothetical protein C494_11310 [Natronorubrum bangense JCM 10635]QCC53734.1 DUF4382 domain-containing protein [Natronorubrum bangense]
MDRRTYLGSVGAVVATSTIAGCTGSDDSEEGSEDDDETQYGTLSTSITDQPNDIDHFESLDVTIQGVWIKPAETADEDAEDGDTEEQDTEGNETEDETEEQDTEDNETEDDEDVDLGSGRYYIEFDEPQTADLVELQGDNTQLIDETEVEVGDYQFLQLDVSDTVGTLKEGDDEPDVETPGNAPLQFKQSFEIRAEETTRFIADFAPFQTGQGKYIIRPVATGTQVLYGDEEYTGNENDEDGDSEDDDEAAGGNQDIAAGNGN